MTAFRHKGCSSELIRFVGSELRSGMVMVATDWRLPDGTKPKEGQERTVTCPDCGEPVCVAIEYIERIDA